jgi:pSer/pThr/pTyr-binding forkhead associated (FHA) protein
MSQSPLAPHAATPAELRERIEAERRGTPFLVYRDGDGGQAILDLGPAGERIAVGRRESNEVPLPWDTEVSRVHAELERVGDDWAIVDDGLSRNGSWVNGARITGRHRLRDGDVIRVGQTTLVFRAPEHSVSEATAIAANPQIALELTPTQRKVLVALCRPYKHSDFATPATNQQIADELHLSVDAVKAQLRTLFQAFGIEQLPQNQKRSRLVLDALQSGSISPREL